MRRSVVHGPPWEPPQASVSSEAGAQREAARRPSPGQVARVHLRGAVVSDLRFIVMISALLVLGLSAIVYLGARALECAP